MFYYIIGIILGAALMASSIILFLKQKDKFAFFIGNIVFAIAFIGSGVSGFLIPEKFSYISILLLLVFCIGYLVFSTILLKKSKNTQKTKINSGK